MSIPQAVFEELRAVCAAAHRRWLLSGFNGNASVRLDDACCCVTRSGSVKGDLRPEDLAVVEMATGRILEGATPSTELSLHLEIYGQCPEVRAVLHTHPRHLLALDLRVTPENFLHMPLFEAEMLCWRLGRVPELPPGSRRLALAVARVAVDREAVWLTGHGLVCRASSLGTALALSEELDHLAAIQLLAS